MSCGSLLRTIAVFSDTVMFPCFKILSVYDCGSVKKISRPKAIEDGISSSLTLHGQARAHQIRANTFQC